MAVIGVSFAGAIAAPVAGASGGGTDTWSGQAPAGSPGWSLTANWQAHTAPVTGDSLDFPVLAGTCTNSSPSGTCYTTTNDITGLDLPGITVDGAASYTIAGDAVSLDNGGLTVVNPSASPVAAALTTVSLPISLTADQTWTFGGNAGLTVNLNGAVTGAPKTLGVSLSDGVAVNLNGHAEVGAVAVTGASNLDTGATAAKNGTLNLGSAGDINGTNTNAVSVTDAKLLGAGTVGALTTTGADLSVGRGASPGVLAPSGNLTLDPASVVQFKVPGPGSTPGTNYSAIDGSGATNALGPNANSGAKLSVAFGTPSACFLPNLGQVYQLVSMSSGNLTGVFDNMSGQPVLNNDTIPLTIGPSCASTPDLLQINYASGGVTATVVAPTTTTAKVNGSSTATVADGTSVAFSATVTSAAGTVSSGHVDFNITTGHGTQTICQGAVSAGAATCSSAATPINDSGWPVVAQFVPAARVGLPHLPGHRHLDGHRRHGAHVDRRHRGPTVDGHPSGQPDVPRHGLPEPGQRQRAERDADLHDHQRGQLRDAAVRGRRHDQRRRRGGLVQ